jgi:hypothetical protein
MLLLKAVACQLTCEGLFRAEFARSPHWAEMQATPNHGTS